MQCNANSMVVVDLVACYFTLKYSACDATQSSLCKCVYFEAWKKNKLHPTKKWQKMQFHLFLSDEQIHAVFLL